MKGKKIFIVVFIIAITVLIVMCVIKFNVFKMQKSMSNHSELFLASQIPEIECDHKKEFEDEELAEKENIPERNYIDEIENKKEEVKDQGDLDEIAIFIEDDFITKRDVEYLKIINEVMGEYLITDKRNKLKYDIITLVRARIFKKEVERKTDMPSRDMIVEESKKQKDMFEQSGDRNRKKYIASLGMSEEEFWKNFDANCIYTLRQEQWETDVVLENISKIEREAEKMELTVAEYVHDFFVPLKIDELVNESKIEIVDPEIKALFGLADKND